MRKNIRAPKSKQRGITLIEGIVYLILSVLVISYASGRIGNIFGKNETAEEIGNLNNLIVATKTLRSNGNYGAAGADLVPSLIAIEGVPKGMPVVSSKIKNTWNGDVTVVATAQGFTVTSPSVPKAACIEVANKVSRGGALQTKIGSATVVTGEYTNAQATTDCSAATNSLAFTVTN